MGTVAAPLLASLSIALVAVVVTSPKDFRAADLTVLLLVVSAVGFIGALECSFMARQYVVAPTDLEGWWPDHESLDRRENLRRAQREHLARFRKWAVRARLSYNVGIVALTAGLGALLWPRSVCHTPPLRIAVLVTVLAALVVQIVWIAKTAFREDQPDTPVVGPESSAT